MTRNAIDAATATSFLLLPERRWLILVHTIPVYISLWCVYIVVKLATQLFLRGLTAVIATGASLYTYVVGYKEIKSKHYFLWRAAIKALQN